jgi:hypothetical protein
LFKARLIFFSFSMRVCSLVHLASKKVALLKRQRVHIPLTRVPKVLVEEVVSHMDANPMVEFLESAGSIMNIKKTFSTHGFQKFLLRFYILFDKDLHLFTKTKMVAFLAVFAQQYPSHLDYFVKNSLGKTRITVVDWSVKSLGIFDDLEQIEAFIPTHELKFFNSKFAKKVYPHIRVPIPTFPPEWIELLPDQVDTSVLPHMNDVTIEKPAFREKANIESQFFCRMLALSEAFMSMRHHETLAHGFELLARKDFFAEECFQRYFLNVYGIIAVTLAQLNVEYAWCVAFLDKAKELALVLSQTLDILYYQQQMYFHLNHYINEVHAFNRLFKSVPVKSKFHILSFRTHLKCFVHKIENLLCKILCYKHMQNQTEKDRNIMLRLIRDGEFICQKEKRFIHSCLAIPQTYENVFEFAQTLVQVYTLCLQVVQQTNHVIPHEKLNMLAYELKKMNDFRGDFFRHMGQHSYNIAQYHREIEKSKKHMETSERMIENQHWGDICFTLFILFSIIDRNSNRAADWLQDSFKIFKKCNSERARLCQQFINKTAVFEHKNFDYKKQTCDVQQLLRENKKVALYIKLGVLSIAQADITA